MIKEEALATRRMEELSKAAYQRDIITYSDFLSLNERNILCTLPKEHLYTDFVTFGGYDLAERQMAAFIPDALYLRKEANHVYEVENFVEPVKFPFSVVSVEPVNGKYAGALSHRDYLGAILNLGIDRCKVGDIVVEEDRAVVFVSERLCEFLCDELTRISHTSVKTKKLKQGQFHYTPLFKKLTGTVASVRLDSLLSLAFSSSRNKLSRLIEGEKVLVNGRLITTNSYQVRKDDIISVRGMGKFKYVGSAARSKKNRIFVEILKYI